jgi:hypothetical protein
MTVERLGGPAECRQALQMADAGTKRTWGNFEVSGGCGAPSSGGGSVNPPDI